jgi:hypothetical protein
LCGKPKDIEHITLRRLLIEINDAHRTTASHLSIGVYRRAGIN